MKTFKAPSVNFEAQFKFAEQNYPYNELKSAISKPISKGKDVLNFIAYINSKEGRTQLEKLPKDDVVELMLFNEDDNGNVFLDPYFYYSTENFSHDEQFEFESRGLEGRLSDTKNMKKTFVAWTKDIISFLDKK